MEIVDVVDKNNRVVYQIAKQIAHERGLLHRTVIAEVIDSQGRWTLVKQAADRQDAGLYVSPVGGHVRAGETEIEALGREAAEEMGLTNITYKYIGRAIFNRKILGRLENHYFILFEIYSEAQPKLNHESVGFKQFTVEELERSLLTDPRDFGEAFHFVVKTFYPRLFK